MSFKIVTVNETLVVDSRLVAEGLGIEHSNTFVRTIQKYKAEFEELGVLVMGSQKPNCNYSSYTKGGRPSDHISLTVDCFKSLGMMAGTQINMLIPQIELSEV